MEFHSSAPEFRAKAPKKQLTSADKETIAKKERENEAREMVMSATNNIYEERVKNGTANEFEKAVMRKGGLRKNV